MYLKQNYVRLKTNLCILRRDFRGLKTNHCNRGFKGLKTTLRVLGDFEGQL